MKNCAKCREGKPLSEFYADKRASDGKRSWCKACHSASVIAWREANPDKVKNINSRERRGERCVIYDATYMRKHRPMISERQRQYRAENRQKDAARNKLNRAVRSGVMERAGSCGKCGSSSKRIEAHHPDHSMPLSVEWLCAKCHRAVDRAALGEGE